MEDQGASPLAHVRNSPSSDASFEKEGAELGGILYNSKAQPLKWFAEWIDPCDLVPFGSEIKDGLIFELEVFASVQGAIAARAISCGCRSLHRQSSCSSLFN